MMPVWSTLGNALLAPFMLEASSWKALARPVLALLIVILLSFLGAYQQWNESVGASFLLLAYAAVAWCALEYQRQLLLGAAACKAAPMPWNTYGRYLLIVVIACVVLAVLLGMLLNMVLPAITFFALAINSPRPSTAIGLVVVGILVGVAVAYPILRFALIFPAVAVGHDVAPRRMWRLSRGNGLRLFVLLVLIPGLFSTVRFLYFEFDMDFQAATGLTALLDAYLVLVYLSTLALAYRALSDQPLPVVARAATGVSAVLGARARGPVLLALFAGLGAVSVWIALYRVDPGESVLISRWGKSARIESEPGVHVKIPLLEKEQRVATTDSYRSEGRGRFLTLNKDAVSLQYASEWRVADIEVFTQATGGRSAIADRRIDDLFTAVLRERVASLTQEEVERLRGSGRLEFSLSDGPDSAALLDGVLENVNSRVAMLGIEITAWGIGAADPENGGVDGGAGASR